MYSTNSLQLASFLATTEGVNFVGVNSENMNSVDFQFEPEESAQEATKLYFSGKAQVNPKDLYQNYRMLKDLVFDAKRKAKPTGMA